MKTTSSILLALGLLAPLAQAQWKAGPDMVAYEANAVTSSTNGQWSYGYRPTLSGTAFASFTPGEHTDTGFTAPGFGSPNLQGFYRHVPADSDTPSVIVNTGAPLTLSNFQPLASNKLMVHPGPANSATSVVVVRWIAPSAGVYYISANWKDLDTNNPGGAIGAIVINGTVQFSQLWNNGGSAAKTITPVVLNTGATVDFAVDPDVNYFSDSTQFDASIKLLSTTIQSTAAGTYLGIIQAETSGFNPAGGRLDMNITGNALSWKVKFAGLQPILGTATLSSVTTLSGTVLYGTVTDASAAVSVDFAIDLSSKRFVSGFPALPTSGTVTRAGGYTSQFSGWKKTPQLANMVGRYNFVLGPGVHVAGVPDGLSWASFSVANTGSYTIAGRTACDEPFTCVAFVGPESQTDNVAIYAVQPSGSVIRGTCLLDEASPIRELSPTSLGINWFRPFTASPLYGSGFNQTVAVQGGLYNNPTLPPITQFKSGSPTHQFNFALGGTPGLPPVDLVTSGRSVMNPDRVIPTVFGTVFAPSGGPANTRFKIDGLTGKTTATGNDMVLVDPNTQNNSSFIRKIKFSGILVPTSNPNPFYRGAYVGGYFVLPSLPGSGLPTESGLWTID